MTKAQKTTTLPFRADHVGSFLRTEPLKDARLKFAAGEIDAAALDQIETEEITKHPVVTLDRFGRATPFNLHILEKLHQTRSNGRHTKKKKKQPPPR